MKRGCGCCGAPLAIPPPPPECSAHHRTAPGRHPRFGDPHLEQPGPARQPRRARHPDPRAMHPQAYGQRQNSHHGEASASYPTTDPPPPTPLSAKNPLSTWPGTPSLRTRPSARSSPSPVTRLDAGKTEEVAAAAVHHPGDPGPYRTGRPMYLTARAPAPI